MSASRLSIDCDGGTGSQVVADLRDNPFPDALYPAGGGRHHRNGGRLEIGTVGAITSERWAASDWNRWAAYVGIRSLTNKAAPGRSPALSEGQMAELKEIVLAGPDLAKDGVVRWRCCDLQGVIGQRFGVEVHERTVGKLLRRLRLTRLQPRPHNPKRDEAAQEVFKKTSPPS